ncbi:IscS subfamily cysteine desulfurase [Amphibacillus cookii]|uniref:IscS subfamily cysteine desulfurase n=1 Tax=Amphibacillus cookii TaxID=767787 RepID=UPI00195D3DAC|nr:IscS subfamily cysteine desulfurase [Amphibacillus cookii]MBM7541766.1 cysteine desulfurase [Amphibacillus cookii]
MIYLDYAASTPVDEHVLKIYQQTTRDFFANPKSLHDLGTEVMELSHYSYKVIANCLGCDQMEVHLTHSGTEANHLALETLLQTSPHSKKHIVTTSFEHPSIVDFLKEKQQTEGYEISFLTPNDQGEILLEEVVAKVKENTCLVVIQHINHEIGTIQDIEAIGRWLQQKGILFHCDGVQAFSKVNVDVRTLHVDSYSISSHKIYGPKGIGATYLRSALSKNARDRLYKGTEDIAKLVAFAAAADMATTHIDEQAKHIKELRTYFIENSARITEHASVFTAKQQLPHVIGILFNKIPGHYAMLQFNQAGIALSTGSACTVNQQAPSPTMIAIGIDQQHAKNFIRLSLGNATTKPELEKTIKVCENMLKEWVR